MNSAGSVAPGIMAALAWIPRLLVLHAAWIALVLLGAVVLGVAPATTTLIAVLRREEELAGEGGGTIGTVRAVLRRFRAELVPANLAAGPFLLITAAAGTNVGLGVAGLLPPWFFPVGFVVAVLLTVLMGLGAANAVTLQVLRPQLPRPLLWRGALAGPFLFPAAAASWTITLAAAALAAAVIQPVAWFLGGGILVSVTTLVLVRTWQSRLDDVGPRTTPEPMATVRR